MYQARILFSAIEDNYQEGQSLEVSNEWNHVLSSHSLEELREGLENLTYSKRTDWSDEQINEYKDCTEYATGYMADEKNDGEATKNQIEEWKQGKCRLWKIDCHILVIEITKAQL